MILSLPDFIGRFHPVLVHLPIGILVVACFFQWLTIKHRFASLQPAIPVLFFWGMLGAIVSCISGYLLAQSGDYEGALLDRHQWMGIATAIAAGLLVVLYRFHISETIARWVSLLVLSLITITGHLGGTLTHGEGYLTAALTGTASGGLQPIPNIQEAVVYTAIVQPVLQSKCYSCHGPSKQKGKLRLDQPDFILKGGEEGKAVTAGKPEESEMIRRILLPLEDKDHMAPKEKPQLTTAEVSLLQWWVRTGADFSKKVKELPQDEAIKPVLLALQSGTDMKSEKKSGDIPETEVKSGDTAVINQLNREGVVVIPVARNSNYLSVNFVAAVENADRLVQQLEPLAKQIIWVKMDDAVLSEKSWELISRLKAITRLQIRNTNITDQSIKNLVTLQDLSSLSITGTQVTAAGLQALQDLKKLKQIYLYQSGVTAADWQELQRTFPGAVLDTGGYIVPILATDTTVVKLP